jgi:acyl-CoA hydrolase
MLGSGMIDAVALVGLGVSVTPPFPPHAVSAIDHAIDPTMRKRRTGRCYPCVHSGPGSPAYDARMSEEDHLAPKTVAESRVELTQLMEATDVNLAGTVHGGVVMRLVDTAAGLAAIRHAAGLAVTVAIDEMTFLEPVHIGDLLVLRATVNDVGTTSMECGVRVEAHDPVTGKVRHANTAYLVFVAVDDEGNPRPVPPLVAETEQQQRRQREAKLRRRARLAHKEAVKAARAAEDAEGAT